MSRNLQANTVPHFPDVTSFSLSHLWLASTPASSSVIRQYVPDNTMSDIDSKQLVLQQYHLNLDFILQDVSESSSVRRSNVGESESTTREIFTDVDAVMAACIKNEIT